MKKKVTWKHNPPFPMFRFLLNLLLKERSCRKNMKNESIGLLK